jgi:hypothetical protein
MEIADPRIDPRLVPPGSRAFVAGEHQAEYRDLPAVLTPAGAMITRWTPSEAERAAIVRGEDVYVTIWNGGRVNPMFVTIGPVDWTEA